ncbi:MAG: type II toxin-antitoxin system VapC family toxin [Rubrobacteraceae bacterium]
MTQDPEASRTLVLDTSVAVKFYVREEMHEEALSVLAAAESGIVELIAPDTIQPEFLNALWWKYRRGEFSREEVRKGWERFTEDEAASLYALEDLMARAAGITLETGVIVYDALFLALAEEMETPLVTADDKLLRATRATKYSRLAQSLTEWTLDRR